MHLLFTKLHLMFLLIQLLLWLVLKISPHSSATKLFDLLKRPSRLPLSLLVRTILCWLWPLGSAGWCWRMSSGFRALTTKDWSCCSWGPKLLGYVQQSLDAWGHINFYRLSKRTAFLAGLLMPRTWLWATMMNAVKANQKREAVQAEGFCYCAGNGPIAPVIILMDGTA